MLNTVAAATTGCRGVLEMHSDDGGPARCEVGDEKRAWEQHEESETAARTGGIPVIHGCEDVNL